MTGPTESGYPSENPAGAPSSGRIVNLHDTTDARFIIGETIKLATQVERLVVDVKDHGDKIDAMRMQLTALATLPELLKDQGGKLDRISNRLSWIMGIGTGLGIALVILQAIILAKQHLH